MQRKGPLLGKHRLEQRGVSWGGVISFISNKTSNFIRDSGLDEGILTAPCPMTRESTLHSLLLEKIDMRDERWLSIIMLLFSKSLNVGNMVVPWSFSKKQIILLWEFTLYYLNN